MHLPWSCRTLCLAWKPAEQGSPADAIGGAWVPAATAPPEEKHGDYEEMCVRCVLHHLSVPAVLHDDDICVVVMETYPSCLAPETLNCTPAVHVPGLPVPLCCPLFTPGCTVVVMLALAAASTKVRLLVDPTPAEFDFSKDVVRVIKCGPAEWQAVRGALFRLGSDAYTALATLTDTDIEFQEGGSDLLAYEEEEEEDPRLAGAGAGIPVSPSRSKRPGTSGSGPGMLPSPSMLPDAALDEDDVDDEHDTASELISEGNYSGSDGEEDTSTDEDADIDADADAVDADAEAEEDMMGEDGDDLEDEDEEAEEGEVDEEEEEEEDDDLGLGDYEAMHE